ncbi:hypothetical protein FB45DRAFT_901769 [Roridomyces roridus]|uniref:F-box domain-containing protein n=1 Tax=Roridomyces roridus TaxID=1738132 RepID=A0AAD7C8X6_9AGAR|nr:hypothetical protein FB45DRAFT_901769 [Roridomyces roridus]
MSTTVGFASLDDAILSRILALLAPKKLAPHKRLVPLLRVNKHWHSLVLPLLYTAISVKGIWIARPLRKTLEANKQLAGLVRELVLDTELSGQDPQETLDHLRIVAAAAQGLRHLTVLGYAGAAKDIDKYRRSISKCTELETLNVSEGQGMFTFGQLVGMMKGWPKLEKLILKDTFFAEADSAPRPAEVRPSCPMLKMVKITDSFESAKRFSFTAFAAAAPSVSVLWVQPQSAGPIPADVIEALRVWAPTLQALCLLSDSELPLAPALPQLTSLTRLDATPALLPPRLLATHAPPALTALAYTYTGSPSAELLDLARALASADVLPKLRAIEGKALDADAPTAGAGARRHLQEMEMQKAVSEMKAVCKRRKIRFTIS